MKLLFTRKTWYFLLIAAAALSLVNACSALGGMNFSFLDTIAFGVTGLACLFLAAEKGSTGAQRGAYFAAFAALLVSYLLFGYAGATRLTLAWLLLLWQEQRSGRPLQAQLRLVLFTEIVHAAVFVAGNAGLAAFSFWAQVLWVLLCAARAWAALVLYRTCGQNDN